MIFASIVIYSFKVSGLFTHFFTAISYCRFRRLFKIKINKELESLYNLSAKIEV